MATEELYLFDGFLMIIDGSDEEALPEDRIVASGPVPIQMSPSQIQLKLPRHCILASRRPALATEYGLILRSQRSSVSGL